MRNSKRIKIVAGGTAVLFGVGVAFAAWTSTGTGTGAATAGSATTLTVAQQGTVTGLYPTGTQAVTIRVTNTNPYPIRVSSVSPGAVTVTGGTGCTAENAAVTFENLTGLNDYLAPSAYMDYTPDVSMGDDSNNGCQGATFSSTYTATGASTAVVVPSPPAE